jgi:microcystin-dependent protein
MSRLPSIGSDDGTWGTILNDFLGVSLNSDGTVKASTISDTNVASTAAIAQSKISGLTTSLAAKANTSSLSTVATSGSYNDLSSKPTIPTLPSGMIVDFAGASAPSGWLICDGSAVSRTTYSALFTAISTTYGAGDGSTTFNLPDFRGRVSVGKAASGTFTSLNAAGGEETHVLTTTEMPSHAHDIGGVYPNNANSDAIYSPTARGGDFGFYYDSDTRYVGGNGAHNNLQPYRVVNKIIKT